MSDGGQMFLVSHEHLLHFKQMRSIKMLFHHGELVYNKLSVAPAPTQRSWLTQERGENFRDWDLIKALQVSVEYLVYSLVSCDLVKQYDFWLAGTTHLIADSRRKQRGHPLKH